jgi:arylsulfatase A-like enzyme
LPDRPNVLLVVLDTVREDVVTPYSDGKVTPFLADLAEDSLVLPNAFSTSDWTLPAHASILSGKLTSHHGVNYNVGYGNLKGSGGLVHLLKNAGYQTWGLSNNPWFGEMTGLDDGFDVFRSYRPRERFWLTPVNYLKDRVYSNFERIRADWKKRLVLSYEWMVKGRIDDGCARAFLDLLGLVSRSDRRPWFAMVNVIEAHGHFIPPQPYRDRFAGGSSLGQLLSTNQDAYRYHFGDATMTPDDFAVLRNLYTAEVAYLDHMLEGLVEGLRTRNVLDDTMIIITSAHGENIGDHDLMEHRWCVYDSLIHIPMILRFPEDRREMARGRSLDALVSLCDLYPTIANILDLDIDDGEVIQGVDLLTAERDHVMAEMTPRQLPRKTLPRDAWERFASVKVAYRTEEQKVIWSSDSSHEVYKLTEDPEELVNVYDPDDTAVARTIKRIGEITNLEALDIQSTSEELEIDSRKMADRLRALGYMS